MMENQPTDPGATDEQILARQRLEPLGVEVYDVPNSKTLPLAEYQKSSRSWCGVARARPPSRTNSRMTEQINQRPRRCR